MSERAIALADNFTAFNNEVIAFVEGCSDEDWWQTTEAEGWTVAAVCRHIASGHYAILGWAQMIVDGEALPEVTFDASLRWTSCCFAAVKHGEGASKSRYSLYCQQT